MGDSNDLENLEGTPHPDIKKTSNPWSFLEKAMTIAGKKFTKNQPPLPNIPKSEEVLIEIIEEPSKTNIGSKLLSILQEKEILLDQDLPGTNRSVLANLSSNEDIDAKILGKLKTQTQAPNGYLIGVGVGNVFSLLKAFPEGQIPRAILLFDIDSQVVSTGKELIEGFKKSPNFAKEQLQDKLPKHKIYTEALGEYGEVLHKLALEGNFIIARADMTDERLTQELSALPGIKDANNVIYLSNIADPICEMGKQQNPSFVPSFAHLEALSPHPPHKNYFADTLRFSTQYNVRFQDKVPNFLKQDFLYNSTLGYGQGPFRMFCLRALNEVEGEISENPNFEDLGKWDLDHIINSYQKFRNDPEVEKRIADTVEKIQKSRRTCLEKWDEYVKKSTEPPVELGRNTKQIYIAPTPDLKEALQEPYDYDRDFIPFVASTYWQNAVYPNQIDLKKIPAKIHLIFKRDYKTGEAYFIADLGFSKKGSVEISAIYDEEGLIFEEMAIAKLYRETRNRVLVKYPDYNVKGKTFNELINVLRAN